MTPPQMFHFLISMPCNPSRTYISGEATPIVAKEGKKNDKWEKGGQSSWWSHKCTVPWPESRQWIRRELQRKPHFFWEILILFSLLVCVSVRERRHSSKLFSPWGNKKSLNFQSLLSSVQSWFTYYCVCLLCLKGFFFFCLARTDHKFWSVGP